MSHSSRPAFTSGREGWDSLPVQHLLRFSRLDPAIIAPLLDISPDGYVICNAEHVCLYSNKAACDIFGQDTDSMRGQPIGSLFPQRGTEAADQFILRNGRWSSVILRPGGEKREVECFETVIESLGEWFTIIVLRDMTHQRQLERKADVLAQFATTMVSADSLEATLNALARSIVQATGVVACLVPLISGTPPLFRVVGSYGLPPGYTAILGSLVRHGVFLPTLQAFEERRTIVAQGLRQSLLADSRYTPVHRFLQASCWDTVVCVPLIYRGECRGVFTVYSAPGPPPDDREISFFSAIADQAAVAVENARLLLAAQEKAVLEERQRLARDLHDSVSQALYGIALGAQAARASLEVDWSHARESLDYVISLAKATHVEMRSLIFSLHPESLESEGIVEALSRRAAAISERHELRIETHLCDEPDMPLEAKEALYRIAQEALHNVVKHARASCCQLSLFEHQGAIVLEVRDDGVGFDTSSTFPGHLGLDSMRERANHLGGALEIRSAPAEGTLVRAVLPFSKQVL
jgi:PAS domain S-box-containing protein